MIANFYKAFHPSEEDVARYNKALVDHQKKSIKQKKCTMCKNTYRERWNNHGHEDSTTQCKFSGKCVDFSDGKNCQNWDPKEIGGRQ